MARKRYVVRLHKAVRGEMDSLARKAGHLTPTFISDILENELKNQESREYVISDDEELFQLKAGGMEKGESPMADKQISIYLSDETYYKIADIVSYLKREVDKSIGPSYVIRDVLYRYLHK